MLDVNRFWVIPPFYVQLQQKKTFLNYPTPFDILNSILNFLPFYLLTFFNTIFLHYYYFTFLSCYYCFSFFGWLLFYFVVCRYDLRYTYLLKHIWKTLKCNIIEKWKQINQVSEKKFYRTYLNKFLSMVD